MSSDQKIVLHGSKLSGHSHRAELMLSLLGLPYEFRRVDLAAKAQKTAAFLHLNRFGTVPVIEDGDAVVADSAAILVYLASRYDPERRWLPIDPFEAAQVQRWLSVAQGPVFNGPNKARLAKVFGAPVDYEQAVTIAEGSLTVLEAELKERAFLTGDRPTLADVAVYSYVAKAPEGDVSLTAFPGIQGWLRRIEALPGFLAMPSAR